MVLDYNKIPALQGRILRDFLIPLNPNVSETCLLNVLNAKIAQMVTSKRIKFKEMDCQNPHTLNYYALNFISSGGGKDKIVNEIDDYLLKNSKIWFEGENRVYIRDRTAQITKEAKELFNNEGRQKAYIDAEKKKIRNIRFELEQATSEGLYADCETLHHADYGCLFVKISELGLFLENATQAQQLFLTDLIKIYDGKASLKSTKGESQSTEIQGIPCNILAYSDTNKLLQDKASEYLNRLLDTGLVRRCFITYLPDKPLLIHEDYEKALSIQNEAYKQAKELQEELMSKFWKLKQNSELILTSGAYKAYYQYKIENMKTYNKLLSKTDDILLKEVRNRYWKALKLSVLIACIEHPKDTNIYPKDVEMAIYQTELFAKDFEQFNNAKPVTDTEKLFKFLLTNSGKWVTKQEIRKQRFVNNASFARWFGEQLEYIREMAEQNGYVLKSEPINNNTGTRYKLVENNLNKELSPEIKPINELMTG